MLIMLFYSMMLTCRNMLRNDLFLKRMVSDSPAMLKNQDRSSNAAPVMPPRATRSTAQNLEFSSAFSGSVKSYTMQAFDTVKCFNFVILTHKITVKLTCNISPKNMEYAGSTIPLMAESTKPSIM